MSNVEIGTIISVLALFGSAIVWLFKTAFRSGGQWSDVERKIDSLGESIKLRKTRESCLETHGAIDARHAQLAQKVALHGQEMRSIHASLSEIKDLCMSMRAEIGAIAAKNEIVLKSVPYRPIPIQRTNTPI